MGKPTTLNPRYRVTRTKPPITYTQATRFCNSVEDIFATFDIGISKRAAIDVRITVYAEAYKLALVRQSSGEVCEFLEKKYKGAIADLDAFVCGAPQAVNA